MHGCVFKGAFGILRQTTKFAVDQQEKLRKDDKGQRHAGHYESFKVVSLDVHIAQKMWRYFAPGLAPEIRPPSNRGGGRLEQVQQEVVGVKLASCGLGFPFWDSDSEFLNRLLVPMERVGKLTRKCVERG